MKKTRPVTVTNAEILRSVDQRTAGADDARADRLVALEGVSTVRNQILKRELERLTRKHGADHPLVANTDARLQASSSSLRALHFEIQRTSLTPPRPAEEAWTVFGIVRARDGSPLAGVIVVVADANGEIVAPEKPIPTEKDGAFSIVMPLGPRKSRKTKAAAAEEIEKGQAGNVHLEVLKAARKRLAVDTVQFHPTAAVVDYRELVVVGSPTRVDKRAK